MMDAAACHQHSAHIISLAHTAKIGIKMNAEEVFVKAIPMQYSNLANKHRLHRHPKCLQMRQLSAKTIQRRTIVMHKLLLASGISRGCLKNAVLTLTGYMQTKDVSLLRIMMDFVQVTTVDIASIGRQMIVEDLSAMAMHTPLLTLVECTHDSQTVLVN